MRFPHEQQSVGLPAFFAELRRRRVIRVAAVYAVVAWLIAQIAATTFPHLNLPGWMITAVIVLLALGFPIALVLAWAFDLTPDGVIRAEPRQPTSEADASPSRWTGQRIAAFGGVAILALAGGAFVLLGGSFQRASAATMKAAARSRRQNTHGGTSACGAALSR